MRKRILSTLTSGMLGIFASKFTKYARLAKSAKLTRFARPAKFASTLLAVPLATLLCGALFGSHSAYALEAPTITLSISSALVTNDNSTLVPTAASGNSSHYYIPVTIETTNADTYSVNISTSSANLTAAGTSFVIAPANSEGQTLANLTNQWGFRSKVFAAQPADPDAEFGSTVYKPVTTAGQSIVADEPANASQVLMLDFGAGVTSAADSGNYTATVTLAAVATPMVIAGTFQEFTPSQCNGLTTGETVSLADSRDNKTYRVTKMEDGNCWMTQSLAISPDVNGQITTWDYSTKTTGTVTLPASATNFSETNDGIKNWHQGSHIDATNSNLAGASLDNIDTNTGNHYSWYAAIGQSSDPGSAGTNVTTSICPAGWRLPSNTMFSELAKAYGGTGAADWDTALLGINSSFGMTEFAVHFGINSTTATSSTAALLGYYDQNGLDYAGSGGYYWASTTHNASGVVYRFGMRSSLGVSAQGNGSMLHGRSIRCVYDMPTFQDFSASDYSDVATGESFALKDARDGKQYLVAKLEDGNYWMVQNLAIEGGTTLTAADSDVSSNYTLPASDTSGFSSDTAQYMYNGSHTNSAADSDTNTGGYYSFLTATANTGTGSSGDATSSICPKGWRLPTAAQYNTLATSYGGTGGSSWDADLLGKDGNFGQTTFGTHFGVTSTSALVGYYDDNSLNSSGSGGLYWSSSIRNSINAYNLRLDSSDGVRAQGNSYKRSGFSVRCVYEMPTFQDFSASDYNSLATGETITLRDTRDNKKYLVAKLADGNFWMVQNLSLGSKTESITLTPADSNVTSDWTLPAGITSFQSSSNNNNMAEVYVGTHQDATYNTGGYADTGVTCYDGDGNCNGTNSGNYYSWFAATAQGNGTTNSANPATGYANSATTSICPKGWNLPTSGNNDSDFQKLYNAYGAYASFKNAWWPENQSQYTGVLNTATLYYTTSHSYWWSSTVNSTNDSYYLDMHTSNVNPQSYYSRRVGLPVRCVYIGQ